MFLQMFYASSKVFIIIQSELFNTVSGSFQSIMNHQILIIFLPGLVPALKLPAPKLEASNLGSLVPLMKQVIPQQATVVPLGQWSPGEYQVLCSISLSVSFIDTKAVLS